VQNDGQRERVFPEPEKRSADGHVAAARNREKFGQALDDAEYGSR
jgi:hypothetical protein